MESEVFQKFCDLAYSRAGITLKEGKEALVSARVSKRLRALGLETHAEYLDYIENDQSDEEIIHFLDVISTNFTNFFRENDHFVELENLVRRWVDEGQKRFRFWSAASSTGQEPYSIVMTLEEAFGGKNIDYRLLATDISTRVLMAAKEGVYTEKTIGGIPTSYMQKYMTLDKDETDGSKLFHMNDRLKSRIDFRRLNLSRTPFPMSGPLDVVFCRNVMIYFDHSVRQNLIGEIERLLKPGGVLFVGHTESLSGIKSPGLKMVRPSFFRKV